MPRPEHVRAALEDEALELCELIVKYQECECDEGMRCVFHRAKDWLRGYDDLIVLIAHESKIEVVDAE